MKFELSGTDGAARRGRMVFERGTVETPAFMPVGIYGTVNSHSMHHFGASQKKVEFSRPFLVPAENGPSPLDQNFQNLNTYVLIAQKLRSI